MLPSPSRLTNVDLSQPIQSASSYLQSETSDTNETPVIASASKSPSALACLPLSPTLLQKIYSLVHTSRQIEDLARQWMSGYMSEEEVASQIQSEELEETYETLRKEVEEELETVWINAGHVPSSLVRFPGVNENVGIPTPTTLKFFQNENSGKDRLDEEAKIQIISDKYTVDKALKHAATKKDKKRKRGYEESNTSTELDFDTTTAMNTGPSKPPAKKAKTRKGEKKVAQPELSSAGEESDWSYPEMVQPIEVVAMAPLDKKEGYKIKTWNWGGATGARGQGRGAGRGRGRGGRDSGRGKGRGAVSVRVDPVGGGGDGRTEGEIVSPRGSRRGWS